MVYVARNSKPFVGALLRMTLDSEMDLSTYPPTLKGTREIVRASAPRIDALWRAGRVEYGTDDLVAIIDAKTNSMRVDRRSTIYEQLRRHDPKISLLTELSRPAPAKPGAIALWCITGFTEGMVFIALAVVARS
jgi:hypothetical protein